MADRTEEASEDYRGIDTWSAVAIVAAIAAAQREAVAAVAAIAAEIAAAGEAIAGCLASGGRLVYMGAGSSGLIAQLDALEMPGTFGIPADRVPVLLAGGRQALGAIPLAAEDDDAAGAADLDALAVGPKDCLLVVSASGRTPYAVGGLRRARSLGALTVGMAGNAGTPLLTEADHGLLLATPPEIIAGSTRMNAGTAQKCALNMLSTLVGIRLGHVHDGLMVNMEVENAKLRRRAERIVADAASVGPDEAAAALDEASNQVKLAILIATGFGRDEAAGHLAAAGGKLRTALAAR